MPKFEIVPAILVKDKRQFISYMSRVENLVNSVQIDIMDNHFVPNKTIQAKSLTRTKVKPVIQLMVNDPLAYIKQNMPYFKKIKAKLIEFHIEACRNHAYVMKTIEEIKRNNIKAGIAINPRTHPERIKPYLKNIDQVLVMSVQPGFGGQRFRPSIIKKISIIRKCNKAIDIEVDGGISSANIKACIDAGANKLVVGSAIFKAKDPRLAIQRLRDVSTNKSNQKQKQKW